jgi:hypothetical protein
MGTHRTAAAIILIVALLFAMNLTAHGEERFGPWKYFAPYYFPPDKSCMGHCFGPDELFPRYETPPPPRPSYATDCLAPGMVGPIMPMPRKRLASSQPPPQPQMRPAPIRMRQMNPPAVTSPTPQTRSVVPAKPRMVSPSIRRQVTQPMPPDATRPDKKGQGM